MYGFVALAVQPEAPNQTVVAVFMSFLVVALIGVVLRNRLEILQVIVVIYLAAVLTLIPVVNQLGRAVYRFVVAIVDTLNGGEVLAARVGVIAGVVLAIVGIVMYRRFAIKPDPAERNLPAGFAFLLLGLWFFLSTQQVREVTAEITDFLTNAWNIIPGVG